MFRWGSKLWAAFAGTWYDKSAPKDDKSPVPSSGKSTLIRLLSNRQLVEKPAPCPFLPIAQDQRSLGR